MNVADSMADPSSDNAQYGFVDRLSKGFPSQVIIDATEICNLACTHCAHPSFKASSYYKARHIDARLVSKAVGEISEAGRDICQYIRFTGEGEPLLHPYIFDMLSFAVTNSATTVAITTNGALPQAAKYERLLDVGMHLIDVSIDAFKAETYAKIRVNGDLRLTRENVQRLIQGARLRGGKTKIVVSYIEQPENIAETGDFERYWRDQGADYVVIRRMHSNAGALIELAEHMRLDSVSDVRRPCLYPWERIVLTPRGFLSFCPADWTHGATVVNYETTTIVETWRGEFYSKLRQAHLDNDFSCHQFCGQCPDWKVTKWPHQGRSYANMVQEFKERE